MLEMPTVHANEAKVSKNLLFSLENIEMTRVWQQKKLGIFVQGAIIIISFFL
jgi:hypothetical protein